MLAYLALRADQEKLCICSARVLQLNKHELLVPLRPKKS